MAALRAVFRRSHRSIAHPASLLLCSRGFSSKLFVKGLSFSTTEEGLREAFSQFGEVVEANIVIKRNTTKSKGFGYVTFAKEEECQKALTEMKGKVLHGRVLYVDKARPTKYNIVKPPADRHPPEPAPDG